MSGKNQKREICPLMKVVCVGNDCELFVTLWQGNPEEYSECSFKTVAKGIADVAYFHGIQRFNKSVGDPPSQDVS